MAKVDLSNFLMNIRISFHDFWSGFDPHNNFIVWILNQKYNVVIDNENPNLIITMGLNRRRNDIFTIYFSNEPYFPNLDQLNTNIADIFLGGFYIDHLLYKRLPPYYMYLCEFIQKGIIKDLNFFKQINREIPIKNKFCCYISRSFNGYRGRFFEKLSKYKKIDSNISGDIVVPFDNSAFNSSLPKINFIKNYKFNLSFENNYRGNYPAFPGANIINGEIQDMNGYTTEKLIEPLVAGVIPIYWGNSHVNREFNPKTFLNFHDFNSEDEFIEKIIELDNNDELYNSYFQQPISSPEQNDVLKLDYLVNFFEEIIEGKIQN